MYAQEHAITSNEALSLADLPKGPIVVVGAGYISLEFAGIWNGMGKEVHVFFRKTLPLVGYVLLLLREQRCPLFFRKTLSPVGYVLLLLNEQSSCLFSSKKPASCRVCLLLTDDGQCLCKYVAKVALCCVGFSYTLAWVTGLNRWHFCSYLFALYPQHA